MSTDVMMKRGVIGPLDLYRRLDEVRNGAGTGLRNVTVELGSEKRSSTVQTWGLINARIMEHVINMDLLKEQKKTAM